MEHLEATPAGTVFKGHRGNQFSKVIQITTNKQLDLLIKVPENAECELLIRARATPDEAPVSRTFTVLWINVAHPDPTTPIAAPLDIQPHLQQAIHDQQPHIVLITSTGHAFNAKKIPATIASISNIVAFQSIVGLDEGVCCASFTPDGNMWRDRAQGNSLLAGVLLHYHWF